MIRTNLTCLQNWILFSIIESITVSVLVVPEPCEVLTWTWASIEFTTTQYRPWKFWQKYCRFILFLFMSTFVLVYLVFQILGKLFVLQLATGSCCIQSFTIQVCPVGYDLPVKHLVLVKNIEIAIGYGWKITCRLPYISNRNGCKYFHIFIYGSDYYGHRIQKTQCKKHRP